MNELNRIFPYLSFILGLMLGSFYNVCVHRYLSGESIVTPPSRCPHCGHVLAWWENIPLLSYLLLRGRCRSCKGGISIRYPVVEALAGIWTCLLGIKFGAGGVWLFYTAFGGMLIVLTFIDFAEYILPDVITLPGAVVSLAGAYFVLKIPLFDSLLGAAAGAGVFLLIQTAYRLWRKVEGLGTGDIKLMLSLGAVLGWKALPMTIMISSFAALGAGLLVYRRKVGEESAMRIMLPFGPFLSFGAMVHILAGQEIWTWYIGIIS